MEELLTKVDDLFAVFKEESAKNLAGNKAAGGRARKATLALEKLLKEYRKVSVPK